MGMFHGYVSLPEGTYILRRSWLVNQRSRNKSLIAGLIWGNQWLIKVLWGLVSGGGTLGGGTWRIIQWLVSGYIITMVIVSPQDLFFFPFPNGLLLDGFGGKWLGSHPIYYRHEVVKAIWKGCLTTRSLADLDTWLITMVSKSPNWGYSPSKWPKWGINRGF